MAGRSVTGDGGVLRTDDLGADRLPALAELLRVAAARHGTPMYAMDVASLHAAARDLADAFPDPIIRQFSLKANDSPPVVRVLAQLGLGANVVSRGEWALARRAGVPNSRTTLEGVGKAEAELRAAVHAARRGDSLRWVALESPDEARALARMATRARTSLDVLLRLNPDVTPETYPGLAVGAAGSKFGMTEPEIADAIAAGGGPEGPLRWRGLHIHVGSQLGAVDAWRDAARRAVALLALWRGSIPDFDTLDLGGGFPVGQIGTTVPSPGRFARELPAILDSVPADRRPAHLAVEPGRFLVARAGWLVGRVLHVRDRGGPLVVLDVGMAELIRPALYGARHAILALTSLGRAVEGTGEMRPVRVAGPICESTDELGEHMLPELRRGDLVAIRDAGAYGSSISSRYNGRPRPAEVMIDMDAAIHLARRRGTLASLAQGVVT